MSHPPAEVDVDEATVRALLEPVSPALARKPLTRVDEGWDNVTFLVGDRHAVRLPRREAGVALLLNEQRWLPTLAPRLPVAVPSPVHVGAPCTAFHWPWSVVTWVPGVTAERHRFDASDAVLIAETLLALHEPAPAEAPVNPFRGVPLPTRNEAVEVRLGRLAGHPEVDADRLAAVWRDALDAPESPERRWMHGDLHPRNVVVRDGTLVGLIDWGDLNGGDVATDLACAWTLIDGSSARRELLAAYAPSEPLLRRARGWAVHLGLALADAGEARHVPLGVATLRRVARDG